MWFPTSRRQVHSCQLCIRVGAIDQESCTRGCSPPCKSLWYVLIVNVNPRSWRKPNHLQLQNQSRLSWAYSVACYCVKKILIMKMFLIIQCNAQWGLWKHAISLSQGSLLCEKGSELKQLLECSCYKQIGSVCWHEASELLSFWGKSDEMHAQKYSVSANSGSKREVLLF